MHQINRLIETGNSSKWVRAICLILIKRSCGHCGDVGLAIGTLRSGGHSRRDYKSCTFNHRSNSEGG